MLRQPLPLAWPRGTRGHPQAALDAARQAVGAVAHQVAETKHSLLVAGQQPIVDFTDTAATSSLQAPPIGSVSRHETPVSDVCEAFKVARGMIQALQENAGRFASMVSAFCQRLGWSDLEGLVGKFQNRVSFGVRAEIAELTSIPFVKGSRARALYKSGLRTPAAIAEASIPEIAKALFGSSTWSGQDDSGLRRMQFGIAKKIKNGARKIVLEEAEAARVAAFSAFKSLGLEVPQFTAPPLPAIEDSPTRDTMVSPCGDQAKCNKPPPPELRQAPPPLSSFPPLPSLPLSYAAVAAAAGAGVGAGDAAAAAAAAGAGGGATSAAAVAAAAAAAAVAGADGADPRAAAAASRPAAPDGQDDAVDGQDDALLPSGQLPLLPPPLLQPPDGWAVNVLADMELWGIGADMDACLRARHIIIKKLKELEKEAYRLAGKSFSLNATADIADILYTHLKLPVPKGCEKGKLHPSTDKQSLDHLRDQHPIVPVIKEHRTLAKLLNGTLGSICSRAQLCTQSQRYIIHGNWLQTSTATGRLSMEEPNLQCVEHLVEFVTGKSDNDYSGVPGVDHHQINARNFFIPTQENWLLVTADYSQIELRLMAHFSKDPSLIELLSKPDGDVFTMIASRWVGKEEALISSKERENTKRFIYGILYGMGANTLAEQLECSTEEAAQKIRSFKKYFPGVSSWLHEAVASCRQKGYVETLMGRRRFLAKIMAGNSKEKAKAQRQAVNSICQGSAADIIKVAMIRVHSVITNRTREVDSSDEVARNFAEIGGHCHLILQVFYDADMILIFIYAVLLCIPEKKYWFSLIFCLIAFKYR
nr:unnamed protein product [Digitaria exilis]